MAKRCSFCHSRKCDGGPYCPRDRKRDREKERLRARERYAAHPTAVCKRGHRYEIGQNGCKTCRGDRLRERAERERGLIEPRPKRILPPPIAMPLPPYFMHREELAKEREASMKRRQAIVDAAIARAKRLEAEEDAALPMWMHRKRKNQARKSRAA